jgi:tetratricopeptide (TPR) repeat protein
MDSSNQPETAEAYNNRGHARKAKADFDGAIADYSKVIELKPDAAVGYYNRGDAKRLKGDLDGALADYNQAFELKLNVAQAYNNRGEVKRAKNDLDGALADYNKAIELKPDFSQAYSNRGLLKRIAKNFDGALADYDKAIELKPDSAEAYNNRGLLKQIKSDLNGALADYDKAIGIKPDSAIIRKNRDGALQAIKENSLVLRTDFSNESAWKAVCAAIQDLDAEFSANVNFVSEQKYDGLETDKLLPLLSGMSPQSFAFIVDNIALTNPEHAILVVDLKDKPGQTFRVIPSALWEVENNLSIANMDFEEFASAVGKDGIFRGFSEE